MKDSSKLEQKINKIKLEIKSHTDEALSLFKEFVALNEEMNFLKKDNINNRCLEDLKKLNKNSIAYNGRYKSIIYPEIEYKINLTDKEEEEDYVNCVIIWCERKKTYSIEYLLGKGYNQDYEIEEGIKNIEEVISLINEYYNNEIYF